MPHEVQIDIKNVENGTAKGYLYTGNRCVYIEMEEYEYKNLIRDGFFIRDGKSRDSANVLNTTNTFKEQTHASMGN